jgi:hypothetical protein
MVQRQALDGANPFALITLFHSNKFENANGTDILYKDELALAR